jgi:hypothetical protein
MKRRAAFLLVSMLTIPTSVLAAKPQACSGYHRDFFGHFLAHLALEIDPRGVVCKIDLTQDRNGKVMAFDLSDCPPAVRPRASAALRSMPALPLPQSAACWAREVELALQVRAPHPSNANAARAF